MKALTVYKASAGSGKTFTLACEYIKLLIDSPYSFRSILAVTFTNKATEEMKMRILSQLYGIWKRLPESRAYTDIITKALDIGEQQAAERAGVALRHLIHNYNYFRVETIDSFFQSVLRNLARELDLTANLKIGLNDRQVEEMAVDRLIESLDNESVVLKWLIGYIFTNISDNKSWNVIGAIKKFGENIFKDDYKNNSQQLNTLVEQDFFATYQKQLRLLRDEARNTMADYAEKFEKATREAGLETTSFAGKNRGIGSYFNKLKGNKFSDANCINKTLNDCLQQAEKWTTKTSADRHAIIQLVEGKLMELLHRAENDRKKKWRDYCSANATLRHLNELQLLNRIEGKVRMLNEEANRFLLSDTQYLLHALISDSDSPFIFEKVGCQLEHIMIDEFQDTSTVQWMNFKVLLNECMSRATGHNDQLVNNLIVGDVKQSIYRWRAGDWRLLNGIERQFDKQQHQVFVTNLSTNYRSESNIIRFNNAFFEAAAKHEHQLEREVNDEATAGELTTAYAELCQKIPPHRRDNGYVQINLLPEEDYETQTLQLMCDTVTSLMQQGVKPRQMAVLIRYNKHIPVIADYFMRHLPEVKLVSDEAFRLDASMAVNIIVLALRLLIHPDDMLCKVRLAVSYQKHVLDHRVDEKDIILFRQHDEDYLDHLLPAHFTEQHDEILKKPFFDILEDIFNDFSLQRLGNQSAYLYAFYDQVADFLNDTSANISSFLDLWEEELCGKTIQSDSQDGIRLISIHKSKGLEFDHVIIPFCDWTLESRNTTLWCQPQQPPFSDMPVVAIDYSKTLLETIYADDYKNEHIQNSVDNLNLLYVAFTRAGKSLFVIGKDTSQSKTASNRSAVLNNCLDQLADSLPGASLDGEEHGGMTFTYGSFALDKKKEDKKVSDNVFLKPSEQLEVCPQSFANPTVFRQSNKSREFVKPHDDDETQDTPNYIRMGNILHSIFSRIKTTDDINMVLAQLEAEGVIYGPQLSFNAIKRLLNNILKNKTVAHWFDHCWTVYNECNILQWDEQQQRMIERRPDRVITDGQQTIVIDFKFGKNQKAYHEQVRQYMSLLARMGHTCVRGYLWYVYSNRIEEVKALSPQ